jgi:type II secretory pathway component PulM
MTRWWNKRKKREKVLLIVMVVFLVLFAFYELNNHTPLSTHKTWATMQKELKTAWALDERMDSRPQTNTQPPITQQTIKHTLQENNLQPFLTATNVDGGHISLQFNSVPFDPLAAWLTDQLKNPSVQLEHWSATRLRPSGMVSSTITLLMEEKTS